MNINHICMSCMTGELDKQGICTICQTADASNKNETRHLPVRTILRGKYLVGRVIGEGGFGITYMGYDLDLQIRVAIKEFCPREYAAREMTDRLTLLPYDRESGEFFEAEKEKFIQEARRLARFRNEEGVVSVLDYFKENGTAYIVMDFIEGVTLKKYLGMLNVRIEVNELLALLKPVMATLDKMHKENIIHRDISPDNIMIRKDRKKVYLIDFGSARDVNGEHSLSVYKKGSYTPVEQQSRHGEQGSWTDVYSLCATIYYCITGRNIPEAVDRMMEDHLIAPGELGVEIPKDIEQALLNGLTVNPKKRTQTVGELMKVFYESVPQKKKAKVKEVLEAEGQKREAAETDRKQDTENEKEKEEIKTQKEKKKIDKGMIIKIALLSLVIVIGAVVCISYHKNAQMGDYGISEEQATGYAEGLIDTMNQIVLAEQIEQYKSDDVIYKALSDFSEALDKIGLYQGISGYEVIYWNGVIIKVDIKGALKPAVVKIVLDEELNLTKITTKVVNFSIDSDYTVYKGAVKTYYHDNGKIHRKEYYDKDGELFATNYYTADEQKLHVTIYQGKAVGYDSRIEYVEWSKEDKVYEQITLYNDQAEEVVINTYLNGDLIECVDYRD